MIFAYGLAVFLSMLFAMAELFTKFRDEPFHIRKKSGTFRAGTQLGRHPEDHQRPLRFQDRKPVLFHRHRQCCRRLYL